MPPTLELSSVWMRKEMGTYVNFLVTLSRSQYLSMEWDIISHNYMVSVFPYSMLWFWRHASPKVSLTFQRHQRSNLCYKPIQISSKCVEMKAWGKHLQRMTPGLSGSNQDALHILGNSNCNYNTFILYKHVLFDLIFKLVKFLFLSLNLSGHSTLTIQYWMF